MKVNKHSLRGMENKGQALIGKGCLRRGEIEAAESPATTAQDEQTEKRPSILGKRG